MQSSWSLSVCVTVQPRFKIYYDWYLKGSKVQNLELERVQGSKDWYLKGSKVQSGLGLALERVQGSKWIGIGT